MKTLLLKLIRTYQVLSRGVGANPLLFGAYSGCRSWPTCSDYAYDAVERNGAVRGGLQALTRFIRCSPIPSQHQRP